MLRSSRARLLFTVNGLPGHRLRSMLLRQWRGTAARPRTAWSCCDGPAPARRIAGPTSSRRRASVAVREVPRGHRAVRARRPLGHHLHLGHHRTPQGRARHPRPDPARASATGPRSSACAAATATWSSTRSSTRFGLQGRDPRLPDAGRHHRPAAGVRRPGTSLERIAASASSCCPGRRRCSSRSSTTPDRTLRSVLPAPGRHRRGRDPGRADPPHARASWPSRPSSPATA